MRAREIEKWLVKILADGAQELADAEVAKHVVRVFELVEAIDQRFRPKDALEELRGDYRTPSEISVGLALLRARAEGHERERVRREESSGSLPAADQVQHKAA